MSPPDPPGQLPLSGTTSLSEQPWEWRSTDHADGTSTAAADATRYTIAFQSDGSAVIRADCNTVLGSYSANGSQLSIKPGPSTLVGCPPDSQADEFVAGLAQVTSFALTTDNMLELGLGGGGQMLLAPHPLPALAGPTWHLTAYNNGRDAVQSTLADSEVNAVFGADDGRVTGSGGCNRYIGPYQADGGSLTIGPLASTRMACDQPRMDQEAAFLKALEATTRYRFENDLLVLRDASGAMQAILTQTAQ